MALDSMTALPDRFNAGTTLIYTRAYSDFPAGQGWALTLHLSGGASLSAAGAASGNSFVITVLPAKTATVSVSGCSYSAGSPVLTRAAGSFATDNIIPGYLVSAPGIPSGAYVKTVDSATQVTLSEPATAAGSSLSATFRFPSGLYSWEERAANAGAVYSAGTGLVSIDPDIAGAPAGSFQSWEQRMLPLVEDILEGRITSDMESYQIADRAKTAVRVRDWLAFRSYLRSAISQQRSPGRFIMARGSFTGASAE